MKQIIIFFLIILVGCKKNEVSNNFSDTLEENKGFSENYSLKSVNLISFIGGAYRLIGGNADSIQVNFTQPAPSTGWVVSFTSSDPSVQIPSTFRVSPGEFIIHIPLISTHITSAKLITLSVILGNESKSYTLKLFPFYANFPAPQLQSPGDGSGVKNRIQVKFQWSNNQNAFYHDIQISDDLVFSNPMLEVYVNDPIWVASYFNGLGRRYWRVRYIDASGRFGPWSPIRNFEVKE